MVQENCRNYRLGKREGAEKLPEALQSRRVATEVRLLPEVSEGEALCLHAAGVKEVFPTSVWVKVRAKVPVKKVAWGYLRVVGCLRQERWVHPRRSRSVKLDST